ncbi:MAG: M50 family metallopeptidase [Colwellia sp.]|nr:M50 family metallopeptidase [Colwellia sp.]
MPNISSEQTSSFWQKYHFFILLIAAVVIKQLPLVSIPFNWLESYFHEISHGIAAIVTGGNVLRIQLFANGAGLCTTQGGIGFVISFAGYAGATFWGWGIYKLASAHQRLAQGFSVLVFLLIVSSIIFWGRDPLTWFILAVLAALFLLTIKLKKLHYLQRLMQLFGLLILLNSLSSPSYLLDGRNLGDGAALATMTFIPEIIWVFIWFSLALVALYSLYKTVKKHK